MPRRVVLPHLATLAVASLAVSTAGVAVAPEPLAAQTAGQTVPRESGIITGRVTETGSGRPLGDVQIFVVGTRLGAVSDANGNFRIANVPAGPQSLRARRIGYSVTTQAVTVAAGAPAEVALSLGVAATELERIVVTGTAGPTSQRTVGNAITQLNVDDLTKKSAITNVTEVLQGKTPGVTILPGSGTPGTAADIRLRGTSSLVGSNRPIFYVDGIRYYDGQQGNLKSAGNGIDNAFSQGTSALDMISPEDIESIEVIKGPAAATLYGADAAGGVIQIITKKGTRGSQRPQWSFKGDVGQNEMTLDWPMNYTTCTAARIAQKQPNGTLTWPGCQGLAAGTVISAQPLESDETALRSGTYQNLAASVRGGGDRASYYLSGERSTNEGIYFNSYEYRKGARGNFSYSLGDKLDFAVNSSYMQSRLRLPYESEGAGGLIISGVRAQPGNFANGGSAWRFQTPASANIYENVTNIERTLLGGTVNYRPVSWIRNRFTAGIDFNSPLAQVVYPPFIQFSADIDPTFANGLIVQQQRPTHLYTFDYAGTASNTIPLLGGLQSEFSVGVQGVMNQMRFTQARGEGLPGADFRKVEFATTRSGTSDFSEQTSLGYFVQEQIGWANRLFVTGALRADDNSAFGTKFDKVYYPKASLSYVVSEEPALASLFEKVRADNLKLRFAYGQAGRSPGPYDAARTYTGARVAVGNSVLGAIVPGAPGNENLKAERGSEFEGGLDASFLKSRVGLEFTAYGKTTTDALLSIPSPPSSGFTDAQYINFGTIRNSGTELALRLQPVLSRPVTWDVQFSVSTNDNEVTKLKRNGVDRLLLSNVYSGTGTTQQVREGYPVAGFWARDAKRNPDGTLLLDASGNVVTDTAKYVGPSAPTKEGAISSTFTFFGSLRLYALVDFHYGAYLFNAKDRQRSLSFLDERMNSGATKQDTLYYATSGVIRPWVQKTDYVKFRDLSLGYTLPASLTSRLSRGTTATVTLAAHNLGFISKKYPGMDPEVSYVGQGSFLTGRADLLNLVKIDSYATPNSRRITGSVNLTF
ncbi:MAG: SusC/RagA family TonB-linked outer membrane protein [Gemmatimonadaceae bacterium]